MRWGAMLAAAACAVWLGCASTPVAPASNSPYVPLFATDTGNVESLPQGTLQGDFQMASRASTLDEAASRWRAFLQRYARADGEFEDAFHANHVQAAKYELARINYLLGNVEEGDRLMKELDPINSRR